ncbi:MAG: hypothetical protein H0V30_01985 [Chitinophagaceae bacterium]|nr:hypothetical protein [Chitinophagaceae bacterium]
MKTIKLGSIALLFFCIFSACTKDDLDYETNVISTSTNKAAKTIAQNEVTTGEVELIRSLSGEAKVNSPVTIIYTAKDDFNGKDITCGQIMIFQLINAEWVKVAQSAAPSASYEFTPQQAGICAYEFKAHFNGGAGPDGNPCQGTYKAMQTEGECVEVSNDCVTEFTIDSDVNANDLGNGLYEFTISYTLTSPEDVTNVKFQGGATAGGNSGHAIIDFGNTIVVNANNNNTVVKWNGDLLACEPQVVTFKYQRNFACPATDAQVTGNWKASVGETILGEIAPLIFSCN